MFKSTLLAVAAACVSLPALAADIMIDDAYFRSNGPNAKVGAAFMHILNLGETEDRLIAVKSDLAKRVELHTHKETDGVMKMTELEDGIVLPAGGMAMLKRGGDHVMFMGVTEPLKDGAEIDVTLIFEQAGEIKVTLPVDRTRKEKKAHH